MLSELGNLFLFLALGFGCVQVVASFWGVWRDNLKWRQLGRISAFLQGGFIGAAFFTLISAFLICDFSILTVLTNDHTELPWYYRLSATWGNHEGSLLLFVLILSGVGAGLAFFLPNALIRSRTLVFQGLLTVLFLVLLGGASNPFDTLPFTLPQGESLNPLLQDRGLLIHPPLLYLGYVGFSGVFCLALAALWGKEKGAEWTIIARPWVLFAWAALTAGVTLGSWWAYYELGWGGWWFWDPVENASLIPWLSGTALLHTLLAGKLYRWSHFLSLLTFGLSLLSTFLVRSGLLTSVHSFAGDPQRGIYILVLIGIIMGFAFFMWAWRSPRGQSAPVSLFSRQGALLLNSLFLCVGLGTVILGTFYPLLSDFMGWGKIAIGSPYFERTFIPLMIPLLLLIPLGSFLRREKEPLLPLLMAPLTATLGAGVLILYFLTPASLLALLGIEMGVWVMSGTILAFFKKRLSLGASLAHMGVAISLLGVSVGGGFRRDEAKILGYQDSMKVGGTSLTLQDVSQGKGPTYLYEKATLAYPGGVLFPEKRFYQPQNSLLSKTAISTNGLRDLYVILGAYQGEKRWLVRASSIPLAPWIWIGGALMVLGAGVSFFSSSLSPRRRGSKVQQKKCHLEFISGSYWPKIPKQVRDDKKKRSAFSPLSILLLLLPTLSFANPYLAKAETIQIQEDTLQKRAQALYQEVRCPVCLGQSVVDSEMKESQEIKTLILEGLKKGESEEIIRQKLRSLYGDEILFRPLFDSSTLFLWFAPFGLFLIVVLGTFCFRKVSFPWHGGS